jgi:hypothetical protein
VYSTQLNILERVIRLLVIEVSLSGLEGSIVLRVISKLTHMLTDYLPTTLRDLMEYRVIHHDQMSKPEVPPIRHTDTDTFMKSWGEARPSGPTIKIFGNYKSLSDYDVISQRPPLREFGRQSSSQLLISQEAIHRS